MRNDEFKRRFLAFHRTIYRISYAISGNKNDAEDITQEVFEKLWRQRDNLPEIENDEAFVISVTKNLALDRERSRSRYRILPIASETDVGDDGASEKNIDEKEMLQKVEKLMTVLPASQQTVIRLRHFADLPIPEIAQQMQLTEVNIRQLLSRARRTMKDKIEKIYGDSRYTKPAQ